MPVATLKCLESPLLFTEDAFEKLVVQEGKSINDVLQLVITACKQEISSGGTELLKQLPLLSKGSLKSMQNGSLVRYRCIIQDMREPEYFLSSYSTFDSSKRANERRHSNLWRETITIPDGHEFVDDCPKHETSERHIFVGGSNPAETSWMKKCYDDAGLDERVGLESDVASIGQCIVKVYRDGDQLKLNDAVEFIGVLYLPQSSAREDAVTLETQPGENAANDQRVGVDSPSSEIGDLMPTLHVLLHSKLIHCHPELEIPNATFDESSGRAYLMRTLGGDAQRFRATLINAFNRYLFKGDELVSEYFLCHLVSSIYARQATMAVGQFSLNIFNVRPLGGGHDWVKEHLRPFMEHLLTQVAYLPMSLSTLNSGPLVSRKCFETDRLISGRLQLSKGTDLIIDETKLEVGQVVAQGVNNIAALKSMISWQKVDYDFTYHTLEFQTDIRILVVSEGPSILPNDFSLPLRGQLGDSDISDANLPIFDDEEFVKAARIYFALAPLLSFSIDEQMQTRIQEDFVSMRRSSGGEITGDYLHHLLTLARMLSLSSCDSRLRQDVWEKAMRMEAERADRLKK